MPDPARPGGAGLSSTVIFDRPLYAPKLLMPFNALHPLNRGRSEKGSALTGILRADWLTAQTNEVLSGAGFGGLLLAAHTPCAETIKPRPPAHRGQLHGASGYINTDAES